MQKEKTTFGILAIVFSVIGILSFYLPILSLPLVIAGFVLALLGLSQNRGLPRPISTIGISLASIALALSVFFFSFYGITSLIKNFNSRSTTNTQVSSSSNLSNQTLWTLDEFQALTTSGSGSSGTSYDEIVARFGKPNSTQDDSTGRLATWTTNSYQIHLFFQTSTGTAYQLISKEQEGLTESK